MPLTCTVCHFFPPICFQLSHIMLFVFHCSVTHKFDFSSSLRRRMISASMWHRMHDAAIWLHGIHCLNNKTELFQFVCLTFLPDWPMAERWPQFDTIFPKSIMPNIEPWIKYANICVWTNVELDESETENYICEKYEEKKKTPKACWNCAVCNVKMQIAVAGNEWVCAEECWLAPLPSTAGSFWACQADFLNINTQIECFLFLLFLSSSVTLRSLHSDVQSIQNCRNFTQIKNKMNAFMSTYILIESRTNINPKHSINILSNNKNFFLSF